MNVMPPRNASPPHVARRRRRCYRLLIPCAAVSARCSRCSRRGGSSRSSSSNIRMRVRRRRRHWTSLRLPAMAWIIHRRRLPNAPWCGTTTGRLIGGPGGAVGLGSSGSLLRRLRPEHCRRLREIRLDLILGDRMPRELRGLRPNEHAFTFMRMANALCRRHGRSLRRGLHTDRAARPCPKVQFRRRQLLHPGNNAGHHREHQLARYGVGCPTLCNRLVE